MPNISIVEYSRLKQADAALKDRIERDILGPFTEQFLHNLGTLLAHKPFKDWPQEARSAFDCSGTPTLRQIYKERLPKKPI